ncbi:MAG: DUF3782 domain-containing protein [Anaerolineae bacterium]
MAQSEGRHREWERQCEQELKLLHAMIARDPIGARWGFSSEQTFHDTSQTIFEELSGLKMVSVIEFDAEGEVFGRPDQVELDVIIQNGMLILCEIKSSLSRSEMHMFARKVAFYEKRHNRKADRMLVISPMVDARAQALANELGIEVYSYAEDVPL